MASQPSWSADGDQLAWLADGVGGPDGPSILYVADVALDVDSAGGVRVAEPRVIVGSRGEPFHEHPVFADW
jgi:hypothetical protein